MSSARNLRMELAPEGRLYPTAEWIDAQNPRLSAVAILVAPFEGKPSVLLTRRTTYAGVHSGQMSFPGGRLEENELPIDAAIRETEEEVGIQLSSQSVVASLEPLYIPPSNFLVYPFVFQLTNLPKIQPNEEVAYSRWIGWIDLLDANIHQKEIIENRSVPGFLFENDFVWGATGMLLNEIRKSLFIL